MILSASAPPRAVAPAARGRAPKAAGSRSAGVMMPNRPSLALPGRQRVSGLASQGHARGSKQATAAFNNPFAKKEEPVIEEGEEEEEEDEVVDGNPFASSGGKAAAGDVKTPELPDIKLPDIKLPSFGGLKLPSMSGDAVEEGVEEKEIIEEEEEEEEAPASGNPFASFGARFKTIDQTVDLSYEEEVVEEEAPAKGGNPFGGFSLPAIPVPAPPKKKEAPAPVKEEKSMGNWERTFKEGVKEGDIPTWTLEPEPIRGANLQKFRLREDDVKVLGRDKGPGIDVVAKVGCVSGVHCQFDMEGNKLYVTDLGSTNGTYINGQEIPKNTRRRVFNDSVVRLGAENKQGEPFVSYQVDLTGAKEMDRNSEYGQIQALIEAVGGPGVVVNFLFINVAFQLGFYFLLQLQTN